MIIVYEPQCIGIEHSEVNASFIIFLTQAQPAEQIEFFGDADHLSAVVDIINSLNYANCISAVKFIPVNVSRPNRDIISRILGEIKYYLRAAKICKTVDKNISKVILLSVTTSILLAVKTVEKQNRIPIFIVLHGILETIASKPKSFLKRILWFKNFLPLRSDGYIKYIVNADFIKDNLLLKLPQLDKRVISFDMPYIFKNDKIQFNHQKLREKIESSCLTITSAGVGTVKKGTANFFNLAETICKTYPESVKFVYAGRLADSELKNKIPQCIQSYVEQDMLSSSNYGEILLNSDILIFLYPSETYKYSLSGVLLDAIRYEIPIVAIGNSCFNYCNSLIGRIGWICHDVDEVRSTILSIINGISDDELDLIRSNIRKFKDTHTIEYKSARLAEILSHE